MHPSVSANGALAPKPLALAPAAVLLLAAVVAAPAHAQSRDPVPLAPVIVSATRFATDVADAPIGASVISADEIRESGINNVNEAVRRLGGVHARQSLTGTQDFSLDLRGFGANSDQNLVVLVDGVRLSDSEQSAAILSSIPIESVERIEIVRGGSSVLYGDGATGGTIHVITRRGTRNQQRGTVVAEAGTFGHRELRASMSKGWEHLALDVHGSTQRADNYRDNSDIRQDNFGAGLQWQGEAGRAGLRVELARQDSRFAGPLTRQQFDADPRQASTPDDYGSTDTERYTAFVERRLGAFELATELAHREKKVRSFFDFGPGSTESLSTSRVTQLSPRIRHRSAFSGLDNELVLGADFHDSVRRSDSAFLPSDSAQRSKAIYFRDEISRGGTRVAFGARRELFDKSADQGAARLYTVRHGLNAWELQLQQAITSGVDVFAKAGRSFRVANVDDNNLTPVLNQPLAPQTSRDLEAGLAFSNAGRKLSVRAFRHALRNEIFYDPTVGFGANTNLDPTRRQGVEIEASAPLSKDFLLSASFQHVSAKFTAGPNAGREVVLVPRNTATLRLNWLPGSAHSAFVGLQWTDSQRYGGDFSNTCSERISAVTTVDARYAYRAGPWEFAIVGSNLGDRKYTTNAFGPYFPGGPCEVGIYPDAGRQIKLSMRYDF